MAAYCQGMTVTCELTARTPRSALGPTLDNTGLGVASSLTNFTLLGVCSVSGTKEIQQNVGICSFRPKRTTYLTNYSI